MVGVYLPPNYRKARARAALNAVEQIIMRAKTEMDDPAVIIAGDFNKHELEGIESKFEDLERLNHGPTRGLSTLDLCMGKNTCCRNKRTLTRLDRTKTV